MTTITLWLLIVGTGGSYGKALHVERFADESQCRSVAATIQRLSSDKGGMPNLAGICVQATVVKQ